jgi:transposase
MRAMLKAQINKTDRNDARGIAQMMRVGLYRPVHVKTLRSQKLRVLLTHRKLLQSKAIAIENDLRATLRNFGLKVGMRRVLGSLSRALPIWPCWWNRCSLSGGQQPPAGPSDRARSDLGGNRDGQGRVLNSLQ